MVSKGSKQINYFSSLKQIQYVHFSVKEVPNRWKERCARRQTTNYSLLEFSHLEIQPTGISTIPHCSKPSEEQL